MSEIFDEENSFKKINKNYKKFIEKEVVFSSWKEAYTDANGVHFFKCQNCGGVMPLYGPSMDTFCTHCGSVNNH